MIDYIKNSVHQSMTQGLSQGTPAGKQKAAPSELGGVASAAPTADVSELSSKAAISNMAKTPPIDLEAVGKIKEAISRGEYPINLDLISDKLMESYLEMKS